MRLRNFGYLLISVFIKEVSLASQSSWKRKEGFPEGVTTKSKRKSSDLLKYLIKRLG